MKQYRKLTFAITALLTLFFLLAVTETQASGFKIYLSPLGNDINTGTKESPLASISAAVNKLRILKSSQMPDGPVEVIIGAGEYFLTEPVELGPDDSGTEKSPVIFKAEEGSHPVFYGGKKILGFEKLSETLWRTKIQEVAVYGWYFEQLFVNGKRAVRAKSPNSGFYSLKGVSETVFDRGKGRSGICGSTDKTFPGWGCEDGIIYKRRF
jgi:hypothetical protein